MRQVLCVTLEMKAHTPDKGPDVVPEKGADRSCLWQRALDANGANLHRTPGTTERRLAMREGRNALEAALLLLDHCLGSPQNRPPSWVLFFWFARTYLVAS